MRKFTTLLLFTVFLISPAAGQDEINSWDFFQYLKSEHLYREAITWLNECPDADDSVKERICREKARIFTLQSAFDSAHYYYSRCSLQDDTAEIFLALYISFITKDTVTALRYINIYPCLLEDGDVKIILAILNKSPDMCDRIAARPDIFSSYVNRYCGKVSKSPWLSGALSALVPGLGKWYAGDTHQARATFIVNVFLGAVLAEALLVPAAVAYSVYCLTVSAVFYAGNIWGSSAFVLKNKMDYDQQIQEDISDYYFVKLCH